MLVLFYSGHADDRALHLARERLDWDELRETAVSSAADLRVLIADACRSGVATRVKGVEPMGFFGEDLDYRDAPEGFAVLSSAAAVEDAQ